MDYEETRDYLLKSSSVEMSTNSQYTSNGTTSFVTSSYPGNSERSHLRIQREDTSSNNLHMDDIEVKLDHVSHVAQRAPAKAIGTGGGNPGYPSQSKNPFASSHGSAMNVN